MTMSSFSFSNDDSSSDMYNFQSPNHSVKSPSSISYKVGNDNHAKSNNIKVVCRFRPDNEVENRTRTNNECCFRIPNPHTVIFDVNEVSNQFTYDRVFNEDANQTDVYTYSISQTVDDFLNGYNGCVLAYGQTGSGKSYTMLGKHSESEKGLIPRISEDIFDRINSSSSDMEYVVSVSFFEIHKEQIKDLIVPTTKNPHDTAKYTIHEDKIRGVYIEGLSHAFISSHEELYHILIDGLKSRSTVSTGMNLESSRSHAIFQIKLTQTHSQTGVTKNSQLFLVDLAGSEKVDKSNATGHTLEEAKKINSSLSSLGNVINALTDQKSTHIPYRDSKLTRILQESIGGNSRTTLIINCSSSGLNESETLNSLRFGTRAKTIKNSAHINTELSSSALRYKLSQLEQINDQNQIYIRELEKELHKYENGSVIEHPNTPSKDFKSRLPQPIASSPNRNKHLHEELTRKDRKIEELENEILNMKMEKLRTAHNEESKLFSLENTLHKISDKLNDVELVNINLKKHLLISEKIIESRDAKINQLKSVLNEQQKMIYKEASGFKNKLEELKFTIDKLHNSKEEPQDISLHSVLEEKENIFIGEKNTSINFQKELSMVNEMLEETRTKSSVLGSSYLSPDRSSVIDNLIGKESPKLGLNLNIIKPVRGGHGK
ncbi:P-loop containing nucleoside triphosphate hydrolase protein [Scheffersomyces coipomensis]|uniref:P-loop containing nucleoside triphosphate hydrolase protein n=1 Tax=Scheffersomyces coipomensis TaxID=1788519 RepID=UPI00315D0B7B